jgi:phage baseplate assembly protein W
VTTRADDTAPRFLDYPFRVGGEGGAALTDADDHVRDLIEQVLLTSPGERVNVPEFGAGLRNVVFEGSNEMLRATTQFLVTQNLNRWLSDTLTVERVAIEADEGTVLVDIVYALKRTRERQRLTIRV